MHRLLERQLQKAFGLAALPAEGEHYPAQVLNRLPALLERINGTYAQNEREQALLRTSLEISSNELTEVNDRLREESAAKSRNLESLHQAITRLVSTLDGSALQQDSASVAERLALVAHKCESMQQTLIEEQDRSLITLESISDGVMLTDQHGHITFLNSEAQRMTGLTLLEAESKHASEAAVLLEETNGNILPVHPVTECRMRKTAVSSTFPALLITQTNQRIPVEYTVSPIIHRKGHVTGTVMILRDVSISHEMTRKMAWQATHDGLTGLWSRSEFEYRLNRLQELSKSQETTHCLLYLDLDQFKVVNDTCGHAAGDELLRQLTYLMQSEIRHSDIMARLGGDEFGILLIDCHFDVAMGIADKLRSLVRDFRFVWKNRVFDTGASIGLVMIDPSMESASDALSKADMACYTAKEQGRNLVHVVVDNDEELLRRQTEMDWASRISMALDENRFRLYAQEIRPLGNDKEAHLEVLLRMIDESGKEIPPGAFIPAAERYGLMNKVDRWVIEHTLSALDARNCRQGEIKLAINLSGLSLLDKALPSMIHKALEKFDIAPQALCFEITETAAISNLTSAMQFIHEFRSMGCKFSLDDFGSGMSSFGYLKNLPVDFLKIDGAFVKDIVTDHIDRIFVETIHRIGQAMNKQTIAEYVEDQAIIDVLTEIGVDYIQGYGVSRPMPLEGWLDTLSFAVAPPQTIQIAG